MLGEKIGLAPLRRRGCRISFTLRTLIISENCWATICAIWIIKWLGLQSWLIRRELLMQVSQTLLLLTYLTEYAVLCLLHHLHLLLLRVIILTLSLMMELMTATGTCIEFWVAVLAALGARSPAFCPWVLLLIFFFPGFRQGAVLPCLLLSLRCAIGFLDHFIRAPEVILRDFLTADSRSIEYAIGDCEGLLISRALSWGWWKKCRQIAIII